MVSKEEELIMKEEYYCFLLDTYSFSHCIYLWFRYTFASSGYFLKALPIGGEVEI